MRSRWNLPIYVGYMALCLLVLGFVVRGLEFSVPWSHPYQVTATFKDADSILPNNEVFLNGTKVGYIGSVKVVNGQAQYAVVGSLPGAFGSFFKTAVQLYNPTNSSITGKIVYHPANASGTAGDPALTYALASGKTITYDDLLPAMSQSGLGSADIVADLNSSLPASSIRVFNDAGATKKV